MGPSANHIEGVKRDAIRTTLRHFRDEMEDNGYEPIVPLADVEKQLLNEVAVSEVTPTVIDAEVVDTKDSAKGKK